MPFMFYAFSAVLWFRLHHIRGNTIVSLQLAMKTLEKKTVLAFLKANRMACKKYKTRLNKIN
jgi:hypothetical protein